MKLEYDGTRRAETGSEAKVLLSTPSASSMADGEGIDRTADAKTDEKTPSAEEATAETSEAAAEVTELTADPASEVAEARAEVI